MIKIVCGLGNPGQQYRHTRHNLGFEVINRLAGSKRMNEFKSHSLLEVLQLSLAGESVYLIKPLTHMNQSGAAVKKAIEMYDLSVAQLFVIVDDFNLDFGHLRIRKRGSSGGHHGLDSIMASLGCDGFPRLRLGVGPLPERCKAPPIPDPPGSMGNRDEQISNFVLGRFGPDEESIVPKLISLAAQAVTMVVKDGADAAINRYNNTNPTPED